MAELNEIRLFLLISLMIFSTQALEVFLANGIRTYYLTTTIDVGSVNGIPESNIGLINKYWADNGAREVVLIIVDDKRFERIMNKKFDNDRKGIKRILGTTSGYEVLFLGLKDFKNGEHEFVIRSFLQYTIQKTYETSAKPLEFKTIGKYDWETSHIEPSLIEHKQFSKFPKKLINNDLKKHLNALLN